MIKLTDTEKPEYLSDKERSLVFFIEKFHSLSGVPPEEMAMVDFLKSEGYRDFSSADLITILENPLFIKSMDARGIVLGAAYRNENLTVRQMTAAAIMTNYIDRRSDEKKLRDLGISTTEWQTWMQDSKFVDYMQGRIERLLPNAVHEAHLGLIRGVRSGNVQAIKLYYEIVDRYNPEKENSVNIRMLLGRVVEVIQKHVKDPEILANLGRDLNQVAIEATPVATIQGAVVRR